MTPRKYKVWWPDQGQTKDDARVFEGFDHEHAASEWAEWYDHHSAEYSIVGGTAAEVQVLREDETGLLHFDEQIGTPLAQAELVLPVEARQTIRRMASAGLAMPAETRR